LDVQRSIKYAENNLEAHILKSLLYMKNSKFKLALNEIEWALDIYPGHKVSIDIRDNILRIIDEKNPI
jgi:hypothetical protein